MPFFCFLKAKSFISLPVVSLCNSVLHFREGSLTKHVSLAVLSVSMTVFCNPFCKIFFPSSLKLSLMQHSLPFFGCLSFRFQESNTLFFSFCCFVDTSVVIIWLVTAMSIAHLSL